MRSADGCLTNRQRDLPDRNMLTFNTLIAINYKVSPVLCLTCSNILLSLGFKYF